MRYLIVFTMLFSFSLTQALLPIVHAQEPQPELSAAEKRNQIQAELKVKKIQLNALWDRISNAPEVTTKMGEKAYLIAKAGADVADFLALASGIGAVIGVWNSMGRWASSPSKPLKLSDMFVDFPKEKPGDIVHKGLEKFRIHYINEPPYVEVFRDITHRNAFERTHMEEMFLMRQEEKIPLREARELIPELNELQIQQQNKVKGRVNGSPKSFSNAPAESKISQKTQKKLPKSRLEKHILPLLAASILFSAVSVMLAEQVQHQDLILTPVERGQMLTAVEVLRDEILLLEKSLAELEKTGA